MGSVSDTMHEFEKKDLRQAFPVSEGWKQISMTCPDNACTVYTFSRDLWVGRELATVMSLYSPVVSASAIVSLRPQPGNGVEKHRFAILVPEGCDLSAVPQNIRKIIMSSFRYHAGKLVWRTRKKNAKKFVADLPA